jgi:alkaline phosphatase
MTEKAIQLLQQNHRGFFLLVEGSQVDKANHANDAARGVREFLAFDEAVAVALRFAAQEGQGETLVIACPDHDTGGDGGSCAKVERRTASSDRATDHPAGNDARQSPEKAYPFKRSVGASLQCVREYTAANRTLIRLPDGFKAIAEELVCNKKDDASKRSAWCERDERKSNPYDHQTHADRTTRAEGE